MYMMVCMCYLKCYLQTFLSFCFYLVLTIPPWVISQFEHALYVPKNYSKKLYLQLLCQLCPHCT